MVPVGSVVAAVEVRHARAREQVGSCPRGSVVPTLPTKSTAAPTNQPRRGVGGAIRRARTILAGVSVSSRMARRDAR